MTWPLGIPSDQIFILGIVHMKVVFEMYKSIKVPISAVIIFQVYTTQFSVHFGIPRGKYFENGGLSGHSKLTWPPYLKRGKGLCNYVVLLVICMKSYACVPSCIYILIIYRRHWKRYVIKLLKPIDTTYVMYLLSTIYVMMTPQRYRIRSY